MSTTALTPTQSLADSTLASLWLDTPERPGPRPALAADVHTDLLIVGGGFTGLWTALRARERDPSQNVLVIEADRIAEHATGRNGGFCEASLTHGEANGRSRWPHEIQTLNNLGHQNLNEIESTIAKYGIDCGFVRGGVLNVATRTHEVDALRPDDPGFLGPSQVRRHVNSPTYLAGRHHHDGGALVDPARLAWGIAEAAERLGVRIAEQTRLANLRRSGRQVVATTTTGVKVTATNVVLATNAFRNPLKRLRLSVVPVYDYVLATEPLTNQQLEQTWPDRSTGVSDSGNQFHYYRVTPDNRILWGGYDAIYHYGRGIEAKFYDRPETFERLAAHFGATFPHLAHLRFTHRWSGVIDTSTRFCAFFGTAHRGRTAYALGFTGLGVGASRFAADVLLDLLSGQRTERTALKMVKSRPIPFPPEPFAWLGIQLTRWSLNRHDSSGQRNLWLRALDRLGLGFDS